MSKMQKLFVVSSLVIVSAIAPVIGMSGLHLSPTAPAVAQWWSWFTQRPKTSLGTRSGVCPMTPGLLDKDFAIISDRPVFAWKGGKAVRLIVRDFNTKTEVWSTDLDPNTQSIAYGGKAPLQPDTIYQWQLLGANPTSADLSTWYMLATMPAVERDRHIAQLRDIEQKTKNSSTEAIANAKLAYLLAPDHQLWSDAIQVLIEVKNPSSEFIQQRKDFLAGLCTPPKTAKKE